MKLSHALKVYLYYLLFSLTIFFPLLLGKKFIATDLLFRASPWENSDVPLNNGIFADSSSIYFPDHLYFWNNIKSLSFPIYKSHIFGGTSFDFFGIGKFMASLPGILLDTASSFGWIALLDFSLCGFFMYLLLREFNLKYWVAFFGGLAYMFNGPRLVWLHYPSHIGTELWFPLMVLSLLLLVKHRKIQYVIFAGFIYGFLVSGGSLQNSLYFSLFLLLFSLFLFFYKKMDVKFLIQLSGVVFVGLLIASPTIFNMADAMGGSLRGEQEGLRQIASQYTSISSLAHYNINFLIPDFWGDGKKTPYTGPHNFIEFDHYFSLILVVLCLIGFWIARKNRYFCFFTFSGIGFYLVMTGFPLITDLFESIPFLGFGGIGRIIVLIHFCFIIAAFIVLDQLFTLRAETEYRRMSLTYIIGTLLMVIGSLGVLFIKNQLSTLSVFMYFFLLFCTIIGLLFISVVRDYRYILAFLIVTFMIGNLFYYKGFNTFVERDQVFPETASIEYLQDNTKFDFSRVHVIRSDYWSLFPPNTLQAYNILETGGYSTLLNSKYKDLFSESFKSIYLSNNGIMGTSDANHSLLDLLSAKYIVSKDYYSNSDKFKLVYDQEVKIYENPNYLPHFYFADKLRYVESEEEIKQIIILNNLNFKNVTLHSNQEIINKGDMGGHNIITNSAAIANGYMLNVEVEKNGYLTMSETYSPYLRAWADGQEVRTFEGNYIQTVVEVPQGTQQLVIKYRPPLLIYLFILAFSFSLLAFLMSLFKFKKGRDTVLIINTCLSFISILYFALAIFTS